VSAFDDFLADARAERCELLELDAFSLTPDTDGTQASGAFSDSAFGEVAFSEGAAADASADSTTLYYSSHGFISQPGDSPASRYYQPRLRGDIFVERKIYGRGGVGGLTRTQARCTLVVSTNTYAGTGGLEGGTDLKGKPKPRAGATLNVSAPLVDSANLIYQVHDGRSATCRRVRPRHRARRRAPTTRRRPTCRPTRRRPAVPRAGRRGGYFRLGSTPTGR
jgi:hypothetical protein